MRQWQGCKPGSVSGGKCRYFYIPAQGKLPVHLACSFCAATALVAVVIAMYASNGCSTADKSLLQSFGGKNLGQILAEHFTHEMLRDVFTQRRLLFSGKAKMFFIKGSVLQRNSPGIKNISNTARVQKDPCVNTP